MRIPGDFSRIMGVYNKDKKISKINSASGVESKKDTMTLSNQAKDYQVAFKAVHQVSDIRKEKISELERQYAGGTYNVSGADVADKMAQKIIDKKI
ncbi:flagellar biosynthesis anti-sigma factor FlgM [Petroclostridium sp. X23]|uniref:flagellar biosynthesis anti-sigma factor FlgM n=1 Tax=Petroclostridium sp. X23 TaxID=3045146 RepID=UPI0024ADB2D2|nr:flagellar biosynthesis anti-sigma factor FlgM [Petroclostridium sp. X23]WHH61522.1 flagellar biosynthesis anti-sigma factor FlgM [Petroclostridium sp. X23]